MKNFTTIKTENGKITYCTNNYGEGLWCDLYKVGEYKQLIETCDFSANSSKDLNQKLHRAAKRNYGTFEGQCYI